MKHAFNAYVTKVLEQFSALDVGSAEARRVCRANLSFLEKAYVNHTDTRMVAEMLVAS